MRRVNVRNFDIRDTSKAPNYLFAGSDRALKHAVISYRTDFFKDFLLADDRFRDLWDSSKVYRCNPGFGFRKKRTYTRNLRIHCGESGRFKGPRRFVNLSRFVFRNMVERGVLPGIYGTGW